MSRFHQALTGLKTGGAAFPETRSEYAAGSQRPQLTRPRDPVAVPLYRSAGPSDADGRLAFVEKFRFLASRLYQLRQQRGVRTVLITSAIPKEGKTLVAANLALMLARGAGHVVLIDGDLRGPSLHHVLGLPEMPGLAQVLTNGLPVPRAVHCLDALGLHYLPAGKPWAGSAERLQDPGMRQLLAGGLKDFDWVILDSPPLAAFADAHYLAMMSDTVLLVARADETPRLALRQAVAALSGSDIAGVVLNCNEDRVRKSYYHHYADSGAATPN